MPRRLVAGQSQRHADERTRLACHVPQISGVGFAVIAFVHVVQQMIVETDPIGHVAAHVNGAAALCNTVPSQLNQLGYAWQLYKQSVYCVQISTARKTVRDKDDIKADEYYFQEYIKDIVFCQMHVTNLGEMQ
uniref:Uncharacterized protein n=1 Tax=Romanomermis culicivorax TaxID=13658 RepID=A0A915HRE7_ROMCU